MMRGRPRESHSPDGVAALLVGADVAPLGVEPGLVSLLGAVPHLLFLALRHDGDGQPHAVRAARAAHPVDVVLAPVRQLQNI
eukprot:7686566-Pyramimonas_sp.AAC.1